ncbi:N-acetylmuramoyl-L-alanine amidase [Pseudofrankia sp. BMG5.37]|nr:MULTISPECIES: N-acetylmuramoyl-L-alanine amidase [unclassified Pseudofrankia]MDT3444787.1 N-acetylmuramoyl-L-alanine amidase [Pseudofrankia sp. BMG5.37]OHV45219.1 cell wall hydrolase [Pseudofrankia sp. BMG5.36]
MLAGRSPLAAGRGVPRPMLALTAAVVLLLAVLVAVLAGGAAGGAPSAGHAAVDGAAGASGAGDAPASAVPGGVPSATAVPSPVVPSSAAPGAVPPEDDLRGRVVVLDPGHDGGNGAAPAQIDRKVDAGGFLKECDTVGASTDAGYPEHAFTWDVANRTAQLLRDRGATVVLTRNNDTGVGPCVDARARASADAHADAAVSIHADGGPADGFGFHVIAPDRAPDSVNAGIVVASGRLATQLRDAFASSTGEAPANYLPTHQGIVDRSDLGGLNLSTVPKVFVECANMRNPADAARVSDPAWRQRAADGIATGIARYLTAPAS